MGARCDGDCSGHCETARARASGEIGVLGWPNTLGRLTETAAEPLTADGRVCATTVLQGGYCAREWVGARLSGLACSGQRSYCTAHQRKCAASLAVDACLHDIEAASCRGTTTLERIGWPRKLIRDQ